MNHIWKIPGKHMFICLFSSAAPINSNIAGANPFIIRNWQQIANLKASDFALLFVYSRQTSVFHRNRAAPEAHPSRP